MPMVLAFLIMVAVRAIMLCGACYAFPHYASMLETEGSGALLPSCNAVTTHMYANR